MNKQEKKLYDLYSRYWRLSNDYRYKRCTTQSFIDLQEECCNEVYKWREKFITRKHVSTNIANALLDVKNIIWMIEIKRITWEGKLHED